MKETTSRPEMFAIERSYLSQSKTLVFLIVASMAVLNVSELTSSFEEYCNDIGALLLLNVLAASGVAYIIYFIVYAPKRAVAVDHDGLWAAENEKRVGLVRWSEVEEVKERPYLQRLDIIDSHGKTRIRIEYQLERLQALVSIVMKNISYGGCVPVLSIDTKKSIFYHLVHVFAAIAILIVGWYASDDSPMLTIGIAVAFSALIVHLYISTPCGCEIRTDRILIRYPFKTVEVPRFEVKSIKLDVDVNNGNKMLQVELSRHGVLRPIVLKRIGIDSTRLFKELETRFR